MTIKDRRSIRWNGGLFFVCAKGFRVKGPAVENMEGAKSNKNLLKQKRKNSLALRRVGGL